MFKVEPTTRSKNTRSIDEAISEIDRELKVRYRCYDRWIKEGKLSHVDATDRTERLEAAIAYLESLKQRLEGPCAPVALPTPPADQPELVDDSHRRALEA